MIGAHFNEFKGIDQWQKMWVEIAIIRYVSLKAIHAEIFKQIGAGPILRCLNSPRG